MWKVIEGDCLKVMASLDDASVDSVVTDPPYGIGFAQRTWDRPCGALRSGNASDDYIEWLGPIVSEIARVLKPGGHVVSFSATRTYHLVATSFERGDFEIRDQLGWLYGSGFPKSRAQSGVWEGWGTALKPAWEPIMLCRKPLSEKTVSANLERWGTGAINVQDCKITNDNDAARWPANVMHDGSIEINEIMSSNVQRYFFCAKASFVDKEEGLEELPLRVFAYSNHVQRDPFKERKGDWLPYNRASMRRNTHPTVKPTALMQHLCRLVTPKGGVVLDPFCGSGSTGKAAILEGMRFIRIENEPDFVRITEKRIAYAALQSRNTVMEKI